MPKSKSDGFIHLVPLLVIAIAVLTISFTDFSKIKSNSTSNQSVLSESAGEDNNGEDKKDEEDQKEEESKRIETRIKTKSRESEDEVDADEENESETEVEVEDELKVKVKIKLNGSEFEFESEGINAESNFPLSINPDTNELVVTTTKGEKVVSILPDQAVENMLDSEKITTVLSTNIDEDENGELEYQIEGQDEEKLLGLFNIKIHKKFVVSATTGQEISSQVDFLNQLLDLLSF